MLKQFQELNEAIHFFPHQIQCEEGIERFNHLLQGVKAKNSLPSAFSCTGYSTVSVNSMPRAAWSPTGQ
jgi:hypothetical protein